jgi:hypothetical protein
MLGIRQTWFRIAATIGLMLLISANAISATKVHVITFGKWTTAQSLDSSISEASKNLLTLKVRALVVDGRIREFTLASPHDVTDRLFVVRRAFRVNDTLPQEPASQPRWQWQRGGWLLVDRVTGRISALNLPEFDASFSVVSWYRDYAAYCGVSDDGKKIYAVVAEINRHKPLLKKPFEVISIPDDAAPDSACPAPEWQRNPARATFEPLGASRQTFAIRGHIVDLINDADEQDDEEAPK